jgi:hypothetical protein
MPRACRFYGVAALFAGALFVIVPWRSAQATLLWDFSYTGPGVSASGELYTDPLSGGSYLITDITGSRDGDPITGLIPADSDGSFSDNLLYPDEPLLDVYGFSLTTLSTGSFNVFYDTVLPPGCGSASYAEIPGPGYSCNGSNGVDLTAFDATLEGDVPEPGTMALLATAITGLGLIRRRKAT